MKKMILTLSLVAVLALSGCGAGAQAVSADVLQAPQVTQSEQPTDLLGAPQSPAAQETTAPQEGGSFVDKLNEQLAQMQKDQYDGLKIDAVILMRKAILSGSFFEVSVTIKNEGDKVVVFPAGSGGNALPDALYVWADGLQTVAPKGNLGPKTMDMRYDTLKPGETRTFSYTLAAVAPSQEFENATFDLFMGDGTYIADLNAEQLKEQIPSIVFAKEGSHEAHAVLRYFLEDEGNVTGNPTGYAQVDFKVTIG